MKKTIDRSFYVGNIFAKYGEDNKLDAFRIIQVNENSKIRVTKLDENFHIVDKNTVKDTNAIDLGKYIKTNGYKKIIPEGTVTLSNIESFINEAGRPINDVILMYFIEGFCEDSVGDPDVYLRQSMDSLYIPGTVGISNLKSEINDAGYKVEDLMYCNKVLGDSYACNVYRTDTVDELNIILNNKRTKMTLEDLYDHAGYMDYNTDPKSAGICDEEVYYKGYCKNLITLLDRSGFINDIYSSMGMTEVDFVIKEGVDTITGDDKILLSLLYGGIRINKTFATKWDYTQDLEEVKTKYMLVVDSDKKVYIVGYTESEEEWSTELKAQQLEHLSERLMRCAKVYTEQEDDISTLPFFEDPSNISTISEDGNENG